MQKVDKSEKISVVSALVHGLTKLMNPERCLKITISNFPLFDTVGLQFKNTNGFDWESGLGNNNEFDFILGDFQLGMSKRQNHKFGTEKLKIQQNWVEILKSLKFLDENGAALYLVEPTCFGTSEGTKFEAVFNSEGYFINAIFNAPEEILLPETIVTPVFVLITRKKNNSVFLAELLNESQVLEVVKNFYSGIVTSDLIKGIEIEQRSFYGFHHVKISSQIEKLETHYKKYKKYSIGEIAVEINHVAPGKSLIEKENSVYIPNVGFAQIVAKLSDTRLKSHNYFQVVLGNKAINEYIVAFFKSELGKLILQSLTSGAVFPRLNKRNLEQAIIALPSIIDQEQILVTQRKLKDLKDTIDNFDSELALNPTSSISILTQLDSMLEAIGGLTDVDEVHSIIRQGESKNIEFKETLSLDVKKQTKEKYIELSVLKTIVAFLNTEGGTLLVGVADDSKITGIELEIEKFYNSNTDKFILHVKNLIKERIGEPYYPYIEYKLVRVSNNNILVVKCKKSKSPCFLDDVEFYVRTNPASDKLEGAKLAQYLKHHFDQ